MSEKPDWRSDECDPASLVWAEQQAQPERVDPEQAAPRAESTRPKPPPAPALSPTTMPGGVLQTGPEDEPMELPDEGPRLCCLAGPCGHYVELAQVSRVINGVEHRTIYRYCRLLAEESGTMPLRELTIRFCTGYSPSVTSLDGWRQRLRMSEMQMKSVRKFGGTPTLLLRLARFADVMAKSVKSSMEEIEKQGEDDGSHKAP